MIVKILMTTKRNILPIPNNNGIFHKNTVIIGFRGSEKKVGDWAINLKIHSRILDYTDRQDGRENLLSVISSKEQRVHRGFLRAFKALLVNQDYHDWVMKQLVQLGESNPPDFYRNFRD